MTIKALINVAIDNFPRLENIYQSPELPPHAHADHSGLDADDHLQYMTVAAGASRPHTGDLYLEADLRGVTDLRLDDSFRATHTGDWTSDGIDLSASQGEWQALYDLFSEERSIIGYLVGIAGLTSGVTSLNTLTGDLVVQGSTYIGVTTADPNITVSLLDHHSEHENGGSWEIDVTGLSGRLADNQYAGWFHSTSYPISTTAPSDGQSLVWSTTNSQWQPETVSTSITGLVEDQLLFGSSSGTIEQSNALTFDGTDLYVNATLDIDANPIVNLHYIDFNANGVTADEQRVWWSSDCGCLMVGMAGGTAELSLGLEMYGPRARNTTGSQIDNGTAVYIAGAVGNVPDLAIADNSFGHMTSVYGIATEDIATGGLGFATTQGILRDVDTSGYTAGDPVYLGTNGAFQASPPAAPAAAFLLGWVVNVDAVNGSLYVDFHRQPYLSYLSDVNVRSTTPDEGNVLAWDDTNGYWASATSVSSITNDETAEVRSGAFKIYTGANIVVDDAVDGVIINAIIGEPTEYTADSITLTTGTLISGDETDTHVLDQSGYIVQEVTGAPGLDYIVDFTGIDTDNGYDRLQIHVLYQVSPTSHVVSVQRYNYTTTAWDPITTFTYSNGYQLLDLTIASGSDYVAGTGQNGTARIRFYHTASGNTSHQLELDYIALLKFGVGESTVSLDDAYNNGATISVDDARVGLIVPSGVGATNGALDIANNEATNTANLITLYNAGSGDTIDMNGDFSLNASGDITLSAGGGLVLESSITNGGIVLAGYNDGIDITGICHGAAQYVGFSASTLAGFSSGVIDLDFSVGNQFRYVTATADVTEIEVVDPIGVGVFYLRITASGGTRSVENLTSATSTPFTFIGNYDLNTNSLAIPSGDTMVLKMIFNGPTLGWDVQVVTEV